MKVSVSQCDISENFVCKIGSVLMEESRLYRHWPSLLAEIFAVMASWKGSPKKQKDKRLSETSLRAEIPFCKHDVFFCISYIQEQSKSFMYLPGIFAQACFFQCILKAFCGEWDSDCCPGGCLFPPTLRSANYRPKRSRDVFRGMELASLLCDPESNFLQRNNFLFESHLLYLEKPGDIISRPSRKFFRMKQERCELHAEFLWVLSEFQSLLRLYCPLG